jgi:hypothetical protein
MLLIKKKRKEKEITKTLYWLDMDLLQVFEIGLAWFDEGMKILKKKYFNNNNNEDIWKVLLSNLEHKCTVSIVLLSLSCWKDRLMIDFPKVMEMVCGLFNQR